MTIAYSLLDDNAVERVAREWCRLAERDPDEMVSHGADPNPSGFVPAVMCYSPFWTRIARQVREHNMMDCAFRNVRAGYDRRPSLDGEPK